MSLKRIGGLAALVLVWWSATAGAQIQITFGSAGCATGNCATGACATGGCATCDGVQSHCCPKYTFFIEKAPKICFKMICPKPICDPCEVEGYGYYSTCWRPFATPPNYEHCPVPPPGALASPPPPLIVNMPGPASPGVTIDETLPAPKKIANPNPDR
jgi:hypothetical protein